MPPYNILDMNRGGVKAGCKDLLQSVSDRVKPKVHVFGHIHESAGYVNKNGILYINAASKIPKSKLLNRPIVVDYYLNSSQVCVISS